MEHADTLLKWSKKILGSTVINAIVRHTFFHQFCAGKVQEAQSHIAPCPCSYSCSWCLLRPSPINLSHVLCLFL